MLLHARVHTHAQNSNKNNLKKLIVINLTLINFAYKIKLGNF